MIIYFVFEATLAAILRFYEAFTFNCEGFILKTEDEIVWKR
jgi:hypothetical protein